MHGIAGADLDRCEPYVVRWMLIGDADDAEEGEGGDVMDTPSDLAAVALARGQTQDNEVA